MDSQLRAYLRLAVPNMPPEVAWPLMEECQDIETMAQLPEGTRETINKYLLAPMQISA